MAQDAFDIVGQIEALRRYARVLARDFAAADDLVQATFLRAHERRSTYRDGADLRLWLMSIMHNLFIDERRSARASEAREHAFAEAAAGYVAPSGEMAARLSQLRDAFLSLPANQREALHLVAIEGLGVAHAATVLDIPVGTVMSRVGRARAALRAFEDGGGSGTAVALKVVGGRDERRG